MKLTATLMIWNAVLTLVVIALIIDLHEQQDTIDFLFHELEQIVY